MHAVAGWAPIADDILGPSSRFRRHRRNGSPTSDRQRAGTSRPRRPSRPVPRQRRSSRVVWQSTSPPRHTIPAGDLVSASPVTGQHCRAGDGPSGPAPATRSASTTSPTAEAFVEAAQERAVRAVPKERGRKAPLLLCRAARPFAVCVLVSPALRDAGRARASRGAPRLSRAPQPHGHRRRKRGPSARGARSGCEPRPVRRQSEVSPVISDRSAAAAMIAGGASSAAAARSQRSTQTSASSLRPARTSEIA